MEIINMLLITVICVIVVDLTDFFQTIDKVFWKWLTNNKPYNGWRFKITSCSLCSSWWCQLLYLIITGNLSIPYIALALTFAYFTTTIKDIILFIKDFFIKILDELYKHFKIY